ncbi:hypothetical protein Rm378p021 [Rhodothermus phage RM378]|uniref:hypothetical protein n=1 Tax=Rhodothermus phage RM378 TaxID=148943 RepID=UPI00000381BB|nr:hypothetical protein Rm378p021 [Rhodothermus phage RM378]
MFSASDYKGNVTFSFHFPSLLTNAGSHPNKAYVYYDYMGSDLVFTFSRIRFSLSAPGTYDAYFDAHIQDVDTITFDSNGYRELYFIFSVSWEGSNTSGTISGANLISVSSFVTGYPENSFLAYTLSVYSASATTYLNLNDAYRIYVGNIFGTPQWEVGFTGSFTVSATPSISHNRFRILLLSNFDSALNYYITTFSAPAFASHSFQVIRKIYEVEPLSAYTVPSIVFFYTVSATNSFGWSYSNIEMGSLYRISTMSILSYPYPYTAPAITYITFSGGIVSDEEFIVKVPITLSYINNIIPYFIGNPTTTSNIDDVNATEDKIIPTSISNFKTTLSFQVFAFPNTLPVKTEQVSIPVTFSPETGNISIPVSISFPAFVRTAAATMDNPGNFSTSVGNGIVVSDLVCQNTGNIPITFSGVSLAIDDGNWYVDTPSVGYGFNPNSGFWFDVHFMPYGDVNYSQSIYFTFSFNYPTNYGNILSGSFVESISFHAVATGTAPSGQVGITVSNWNVDNPNTVMVGKYVTGSFSITASATNNQIAQVTLTSSTPNLYFTTVSGVGINNLHATAVNSLALQVAPGASLSVYTQWYMNMVYTASAPDVTISVTSSNATEMNGVPGLTEVKRSHSLTNPARYANLNIGIFSLSAYGPFYQSTASILPFPYSFSLGGINVVRNVGLAWLDFYPTNSTHSEMYVKLTMSLTGSALNVHSVVTSSYFSDPSNFEWEVNTLQHTLFSPPYGYFLHIRIRPTPSDINIIPTSSAYGYGTFVVSWSMSLISHINGVSVASLGQGYSNALSLWFDHTVFYEAP